jgi:hypothetical protein
MKYENLKKSSDKEFRRVTGVKRTTFNAMLEILGEAKKLSIEDMLLMTLEYLREYRTYLNIGKSYGLAKSNTIEIIRWVENTLIKSEARSAFSAYYQSPV